MTIDDHTTFSELTRAISSSDLSAHTRGLYVALKDDPARLDAAAQMVTRKYEGVTYREAVDELSALSIRLSQTDHLSADEARLAALDERIRMRAINDGSDYEAAADAVQHEMEN
ncbi:MAG: hypothetical protein WAP35_09250 [Solirubrobacterales bacterium]